MNVANPDDRDEERAQDQNVRDSENSDQQAQKAQDEAGSQEERAVSNPIIINK